MGNGIDNYLYYGDNLNVLREHIPDNSIDLIYLDPPFQSGRNYNVLFKEKNGSDSCAQIEAFEDTWQWGKESEKTYYEIIESKSCPSRLIELIEGLKRFLGNNNMMAYLVMMTIRLVELHRVLKNTGSIYLHCDPRASHYLKIILDAIFGVRHFQNELIWCYEGRELSHNSWNWKHDVILFYSKTSKFPFYWEAVGLPLKETSRKALSRYQDKNGRFFILRYKDGGGFAPLEAKGIDTYRQYVPEVIPPRDWFYEDYERKSKRLGYDTQKPEALLERIINASSKKGDVVLDPFCGCGTTVSVAERLKRKWIGIDITYLATSLIKHRLQNTFKRQIKYKVIGEPVDYSGAKALAEQSKFQFECWACGEVGARKEKLQGADRGIDGIILFYDDIKPDRKLQQIIVQVKGGHTGVAQIRDLKGTVEREKAQIGAFITLEEPTREMKKEAASSGFYECPFNKSKYPKLQILTIKELLEGKKLDYPPWVEDATIKKAQRYIEVPEHEQLEIGAK